MEREEAREVSVEGRSTGLSRYGRWIFLVGIAAVAVLVLWWGLLNRSTPKTYEDANDLMQDLKEATGCNIDPMITRSERGTAGACSVSFGKAFIVTVFHDGKVPEKDLKGFVEEASGDRPQVVVGPNWYINMPDDLVDQAEDAVGGEVMELR